MILVCCAFLVVSGCSKGSSFDIAAKRDLMELGLQILNHHSLGGKQSDLEAKSTEAKKIIGSGNYILLPGMDTDPNIFKRSDIIVSYHKDTPSTGGYALNGNGSVELFTIEEFQKAQKCTSEPNLPDAESEDTTNPSANLR